MSNAGKKALKLLTSVRSINAVEGAKKVTKGDVGAFKMTLVGLRNRGYGKLVRKVKFAA